MAEFVRRVCDYCLAQSDSVLAGMGRFEALGWTEQLEGEEWKDCCPVCTFTKNTIPIPGSGR